MYIGLIMLGRLKRMQLSHQYHSLVLFDVEAVTEKFKGINHQVHKIF
jgi:hypothetical protein